MGSDRKTVLSLTSKKPLKNAKICSMSDGNLVTFAQALNTGKWQKVVLA